MPFYWYWRGSKCHSTSGNTIHVDRCVLYGFILVFVGTIFSNKFQALAYSVPLNWWSDLFAKAEVIESRFTWSVVVAIFLLFDVEISILSHSAESISSYFSTRLGCTLSSHAFLFLHILRTEKGFFSDCGFCCSYYNLVLCSTVCMFTIEVAVFSFFGNSVAKGWERFC